MSLDRLVHGMRRKCRTGQWVADSGNTGYPSGPHLHFAVQRNAGMSLESIPFEFAGPDDGRRVTPETGIVLHAPRGAADAASQHPPPDAITLLPPMTGIRNGDWKRGRWAD